MEASKSKAAAAAEAKEAERLKEARERNQERVARCLGTVTSELPANADLRVEEDIEQLKHSKGSILRK